MNQAILIIIFSLISLALAQLQLCSVGTGNVCSVCDPYTDPPTGGYCQCLQGFYLDTSTSTEYCGRCHTSCLSCFGPLRTNCLTCVTHFTFVQSNSSCVQPNNKTLQTIIYAYDYYGFTKLSTWSLSNNPGTTTYQCGTVTILGGYGIITGNSYISTTFSNLKAHFQVKIMMAFYVFSSSNASFAASLYWASELRPVIGQNKSINACGSIPYVHRRIDEVFTHRSTSGTLQILPSTTLDFGIRQFYLILRLCNTTNCSTCTSYQNTKCLTCTDPRRISNDTTNGGTCFCSGNYYQQPYSGTCVDPCPSVPTKYYGDNSTRFCVSKCPNNTYAFDDLFRCWLDCPTTSNITNQKLFRDKTNWRCVTNCPSTQPYAYQVDRYCYSTCPTGTYATGAIDFRCVNPCPNNITYKLYGYNSQCISTCPNGTFADPINFICVTNCSAPNPYKDNSTGFNICVANCPSPIWFGDNSTYYCVKTCPNGTYGQINQSCISQCPSPRWGLVTDNRMCISMCPLGTWGEPTTRTCVTTTQQCNPKYADFLTRTCVVATSCSLGTYANTNTYACVSYCPNGTYGHPTTRVCQSSCGPSYFADSGVNLCVSTCVTQGTYSDVSSGYKCVSSCNKTGSTPWADSSTKTCVNDCNNTVNAFLADNKTWSCVYFCPAGFYADNSIAAPKCVSVCPLGYFADNSTGTGLCVQKCSTYPPQFGDDTNGMNLCVDICSVGLYGDETGNRICLSNCTAGYFAQNDTTRLCVKKCKAKTYGYNLFCLTDPKSCPTNYFGDDSTNLCVNPCPSSQGTFGDSLSKLCVLSCPNNPAYNSTPAQPTTYYADTTIRQCVLTCNATGNYFGNNNTRTCVTKCLDINSYAQVQTTNRICVSRCLRAPLLYYANNFTQVCGPSINCQTDYYGENTTQLCVQSCPSGSYAHQNTTAKICIDVCPSGWFGDTTTSKRVCVTKCPSVPEKFADPVSITCVTTCPNTYYGESIGRTCTGLCPSGTFAYEPTRRCLTTCPAGYFADDTANVRYCWNSSTYCTYGFGDSYLHKCVTTCTGPTPVNTFGYQDDCVSYCPNNTYADSYTGTRLCVAYCPPGLGNGTNAPNLYGDPTTHTCVARCITPFTWSDYQTRYCQNICSSTPIPTYSQNFGMTCKISLLCPTSPSMTFGDNNTRSCVSNCSGGNFGDPTSRNCVSQCPNITNTTYYGDTSTGQYICVIICPIVPRLFGENNTNLCVAECPFPTYGDQTGNRTCVPQCPIIGIVVYYAQNSSRICVSVCISGTWGLNSTQDCVENPFYCGSLWAQNSTNLCVTTCPIQLNTFGDPTTKTCVPICPNNSYADDFTRTCVTQCPSNYGIHGTFANNDTNICEQYCTQLNAYADPQTINRYCVKKCSQSLSISFADPSTKSCVPRCPTYPDLYGQNVNFTCVSECQYPLFANTQTRRCSLDCPPTYLKLLNPNLCVSICPSNPQLFADNITGYCNTTCSGGQYRYTTLRLCVPSCLNLGYLQYNWTCVKYCPFGYYANSTGNCNSNCLNNTFGENSSTLCVGTCVTGFAYNGLCLANCPDGKFGQDKVCNDTCTDNNTASNTDNICKSQCSPGQFMNLWVCGPTCNNSYADPVTHLCSSSCSSPGYYGDSFNWKCVQTCAVNSYKDSTGYCKTDCSPKNADNITWSCEDVCSNGTWGYNYTCVLVCPPGYYAYTVDRQCYNIANRPDTTLFADNTTQAWVSVCSENPLQYADPELYECISVCGQRNGLDYYANPQTRQCSTTCGNTVYYRDLTTNSCVLICPVGYYANPLTFDCESHCTNNLYDYYPELRCVQSCPKPYYGDVNHTCILECTPTYFAYEDICRTDCPAPYFADPVTHRCVLNCIDSYASSVYRQCLSDCTQYTEIGDNSTNTCVNLAGCPTDPDYYREDIWCVANCQQGYADPTPGVRACMGECTQGLYGDPVSKRCLTYCLPGYYAQNLTNSCVKYCLTGYADDQSGYCVADCPAPTFADDYTGTGACVKVCSGNQYGENRTCVPQCHDPNYANPLSRECQTSCPQFDYLFAENNTNTCVKDCSIIPYSYADRNLRMCVLNCSLSNQYSLDGAGICTSLCPEGLYMENSTKQCVQICLTGFAQPTSRYCVQRCFGNPRTYGHTEHLICKYRCLIDGDNLYADDSTNLCVPTCPINQSTYSDPITGNCVLFCPEGYYAEDINRTCSPICLIGYADNLTRKCVSTCPTSSEQTYAAPSHKCVRVCPDGMFAQNVSKTCISGDTCPNNTWSDIISKYCVARCPSEPLYFGLNTSTSCVQVCPEIDDLFGDYVTQTCIPSCYNISTQIRFADQVSRTCVFQCPILNQMFGDILTGRCTTNCSNNQLRDNSTQLCVGICPSNPDYYADYSTYRCVRVCPQGTFASNSINRTCIDNCSIYLTFGDQITNRCSPTCQIPYFADNITYLCSLRCYDSNYYADNHTRSCVLNCSYGTDWITYADNTTNTCVTRCPNGTYAQNSTRSCVPDCPPNQFAQNFITVCVADCTVKPGFYKQINSRVCVPECPQSPIMSYKYDVLHTCVYNTGNISGCPGAYYGSPVNKLCVTFCPYGYFAQDLTKTCVRSCQVATEYADPIDRKCKSQCTTSPEYFIYTENSTCLQHCPAPLYSDSSIGECVPICPDSPLLFAYLPTRQCLSICPAPYFAYLPNNTCQTSCPDPYFAQQSTRSCELTCNSPYFADNSTNKCVQVCPSNRDLYGQNNVCVMFCETGTYRDYTQRLCVEVCSAWPLLYSDNSSGSCVPVCPSDPNYFADNITRSCEFNCSNGTFADYSTRSCVVNCPQGLLTYADPITSACQPSCPPPYFASNLTKQCVLECPNLPIKTYALENLRMCVYSCPDDLFGDNSTRNCSDNCLWQPDTYEDETTNLCVTTCPYGWFAYNDTAKCIRNCPDGLYADNTTRRCVSECPSTQRLFADNSTWSCVLVCPALSYGDQQNWTCIPDCPDSINGLKLQTAHLCVQKCPPPFFAFLSARTCVRDCGYGLYGNLVDRLCYNCPTICPTCTAADNCLTCNPGLYLSFGACVNQCLINNIVATYANQVNKKCVTANQCPTNTFGNNQTKKCSPLCQFRTYPNPKTKACEFCPQFCTSCTSSTICTNCSSNAQYSETDQFCYPHCNATFIYKYNDVCVQQCPDGSYIDYTLVNCQPCNQICAQCSQNALNCTECSSTFLYNNTCLSQCPSNFYSINKTCQPCTPNISSCSNPLNFTVISTVENYKQVLVVKFNQKTVVKSKPGTFLKVKLKMGRRLQSTYANMINDGVSFDAQVLPDGTIKLFLNLDVSLKDPQFQLVFTDPSQVTTENGQSSLQITNGDVDLSGVSSFDIYPSGSTSDSTLVIGGTILNIFFLVQLFLMIIVGPLPLFLTIEAFQLTSMIAFAPQLPPNLFYFLRELRYSRLTFLPSIFQSVYSAPQTHSNFLPQRAVDIDGQLSFAVNGGGFLIIIAAYALFALIVYLLTTKIHSNRPLKQLFTNIYETRIKVGLLNDIVWIFAINIWVCAFLQFRRADAGGQLALASIFFVVFLVLIFGLFGYGVNRWQKCSQDLLDNYSYIVDGTKQHQPHHFITFAYYLRKLLFSIALTASIFSSLIQSATIISIFSIMTIYLIIIRPYQDALWNVMSILNQICQIVLWSIIVYYLKLVNSGQPIGTKILWGQIVTIILIIYLSIALIWGIYRSYNYLKNLKQKFILTQFYKLYLDSSYNQSLEKQLSQLKEIGGQVQSIAITNVGDAEEEIIKLRIKRRIKKNQKQLPLKKQKEQIKINKKDYIKIDQNNSKDYALIQDDHYQKLSFQSKISQHNDKIAQVKKQSQWAVMQQSEDLLKLPHNIFDQDNDDGYQQIKSVMSKIQQSKSLYQNQSEIPIKNQQVNNNNKNQEKQSNKQNQFKVQDEIQPQYYDNLEVKNQQNQQNQQIYNQEQLQSQEKQNQQNKNDEDQGIQQFMPNEQVNNQSVNETQKFEKYQQGDLEIQYQSQENDNVRPISNQSQRFNQSNVQEKEQPNTKNHWAVEIEDLLNEPKKQQIPDEQDLAKKKKMHLMLFQEDDLE